jgi:uncharacterized membrane protein YhhN
VAPVFLVAFATFAVINWFAVAIASRRLEYVAKPAALVALLAYAATGERQSAWLMAALTCSLLGDVLLMLPGDAFVGGLAAFLVAHVAYIVDLDGSLAARVAWFVVVLVASSPAAVRVLHSTPRGTLRSAVTLYIGTIGLMVASAFASHDPAAVVGAMLFLVSDAFIAWNRFVSPLTWAPPAIMITYHLGQLGLVSALR